MATATCVDCDWSDVESAAEIMAGNHRNFDSFAWQRPDGDHDFCIVYTSNRDSGLLDQSNAAAIEAELQPYLNAIRPNIFKQSHNHWAVGHVDGYAIRVYRKGKVTAVFRKWCELQARLADYPVLDEEAYGTLEYEATLANIASEGSRFVKTGAPDDWASQVYSFLSEAYPRDVENRDDQGGSPEREHVREALIDLDLIDGEWTVCIAGGPFLITEDQGKAWKEYGTLIYHASMAIGPAAGQSVSLWLDRDFSDEPIETTSGGQDENQP